MSDQNNSNQAFQQLTSSNLKAKRDEYIEEVRKQKREEILNNNRDRIKIANESDNTMEEEVDLAKMKEEENISLQELEKQLKGQTFSPTDLPELAQATRSEDKLRRLYGLIGLNKIAETNIQSVIDANLVKVLIKLLSNHDNPLLQREAAKLIQTVSSGTEQQVQALVDRDVIPYLFQLLTCASEETLEYVFITLGNFAGEDPKFRDMILKNPGLNPILDSLNKATNPVLIRLGTWVVSNFCRGRPLPDIKLVEQAIPTLSAMFKKGQNDEIISDSAWALAFLARSRAANVLETDIISKLVDYLDSGNDDILIPCFLTITQFFTLPESQNNITHYSPDFLPKLFAILQNARLSARSEACCLLSKIATEPLGANIIVNNYQYIDILIGIANRDVPEVSCEAISILFALTKNTDKIKIIELVDLGVLDCFIHHLNAADVKTVETALQGILNILNLGQALAKETHNENEPLRIFSNKGGASKLEQLQTHKNKKVYRKAYEILEAFYEEEDDNL